MNLERITTLLASGLKPANVATIVGCSPARISQLAKESEEFQNLLALKTAEAEKSDIEELALSNKYHAAEHLLLDQVMTMAPMAELRDAVSALKVIADRQDKAKTRLNPIVQGAAIVNNIVQINIPPHALPELSMTREHEVVSVNNMNLAPLTSTGVTNLFKSMKENQNEQARILRITEEASRKDEEEIASGLCAEALSFLDSREDYIEMRA